MISTFALLLPLLLSVVFSFAIGIVMIVGGLKMMRLQSHGLATTASILALLPCGPAGIIGLIVGIWSLVVLSRPGVKSAFQGHGPPPHPPGSVPSTSRRPRRALFILVAVFGVLAALFAYLVISSFLRHEVHAPRLQPPVPPRVVSESDPARAPSPGWTLGKNGPELTDSLARLSLKLQPSQIEAVNKILQATYQEYPAIEAEQTHQHTDDAGHIVVRIQPHAVPIAKLEDRLWSQVDAILNPEQQGVARRNLRLGSPEERPPIYLSELARSGFFGWGKNGADIEIWRVGTWYHWKVRTRGYEDSSRGPELPEEFRRFWKEPAALSAEAAEKAKHE